MKKIIIKASVALFVSLYIMSCASRTIQAPAFYISPVQAESMNSEAQPVEPNTPLPALQAPVATAPDTQKIIVREPGQPTPPSDISGKKPVQKRAFTESTKLKYDHLIVKEVPEEGAPLKASDKILLREQDSATVAKENVLKPDLQKGVHEQQTLKTEEEHTKLEMPTKVRETRRRQEEQAEKPSVVRESIVVQQPSLQDQQMVQLLEEQNELLRQQLKTMEAGQNYLQQQNERLLTLSLAAKEEAVTEKVVQADSSQHYQERALLADTALLQMEAQLAKVQKEISSLQQALVAAKATDTLAAPRVPQPDTALLHTVQQLRQQIAALQEMQQDSVESLPPLNVYFASGASSLAADDLQKLQDWVGQVKELPQSYTIVLNGFTDKSGPAALNLRLANQRIQAVKAALIELGVPQSLIVSGYMGIDLQQQELAYARRVQLLVKP